MAKIQTIHRAIQRGEIPFPEDLTNGMNQRIYPYNEQGPKDRVELIWEVFRACYEHTTPAEWVSDGPNPAELMGAISNYDDDRMDWSPQADTNHEHSVAFFRSTFPTTMWCGSSLLRGVHIRRWRRDS